MEDKPKDPIAQAMARKRWDKLKTKEARQAETADARAARWKDHRPSPSKKPRKPKDS